MGDEEVAGNPDQLLSRLAQLEVLIAHERVFLASVKFKRKRLADRPFEHALLTALKNDVERRLAKLQNEFKELTNTHLNP